MRAVRYHRGGDADVLQIDDIDEPTPTPEQVMIEVQAASVNPVDAKRRQRGDGRLPKTTGGDFAGTVTATGDAVERYDVGDRVFGSGLQTDRFRQGSFAEYVSVPTDIVANLPDSVPFADGAAVATVGATAWRGLIDHADVRPTESCLVHGAAGGVGHLAIQIAREAGAFVVATAGSESDRDVLRSLGADVALDYASADLLDEVRSAVDGGVDIVLDHRVGEYAQFDVDVARFGGHVVGCGGYEATVTDPLQARHKELTVQWMGLSNLVRRDETPAMSTVLRKLAVLMDEGRLRVKIARTYRLDDAREAHRAVLEDSFVGKLIVEPQR